MNKRSFALKTAVLGLLVGLLPGQPMYALKQVPVTPEAFGTNYIPLLKVEFDSFTEIVGFLGVITAAMAVRYLYFKWLMEQKRTLKLEKKLEIV